MYRPGFPRVIGKANLTLKSQRITSPREITERPHAPSGVAAFMSAHSKTPYITPSMDISSLGKG